MDYKQIITSTAINTDPNKIFIKAAEEANEFAKECCHYITKPSRFYDTEQRDRLIDEIGDLLFQIDLIVEHLCISNDVEISKLSRANKQLKYL